ncbi:MAG: ssDNA-binding domain-containing protein [Acetatifactor sp.]|nr:ssDNA-binding domain-containing protein [Acetatifactor sp.]
MNKKKIQAALNRIEEGLATINTNEDWLKFLAFQSLFYNYSFRNAMLIYSQNPEASYVKGYRAWNELGRYVKKGAKGLAILAPCFKKVEEFKEPENKSEYQDSEGEKVTKKVISGFRITYVFDIADTDGSDECLPVLVKGLAGNSAREKEIYEKLKAFISTEHPVQEVTGTASKGSFNLETGIISVRSDVEYLQKIKTILHEYAHAIDFAMHPEEDISRNRRELIAESVAFVVSMRLGLDTSRYSVGYIKSWLKDKDELKIVADTVQKVAAKIINNLAESSDSAFSGLKEDGE